MLFDQIQDAVAVIRTKWAKTPKVGIILGTGLGNLTEDIAADAVFPYESIPHMPRSTVQSHKGQLVCGTLEGQTVVAMEGRFHFYEGYTLQQVTFPVRVMKALGCEVLIVSNACGGMNPQFGKGDLMLIEDHINLLGDNPLIGPNDDRLGDRFPDMCHPYDRDLLKLGRTVAMNEKIVCHQGVFVAVAGPNLETRAEYRFLRAIGADTVGMSTVPEVIVGVHSKLRIMGISVITDLCLPDALEPVSLPDIIATANEAEKRMRVLVKGVVKSLS
ncbi:MAG: purine-nucleoside phosphorylase [Gemmataceae bacterium]